VYSTSANGALGFLEISAASHFRSVGPIILSFLEEKVKDSSRTKFLELRIHRTDAGKHSSSFYHQPVLNTLSAQNCGFFGGTTCLHIPLIDVEASPRQGYPSLAKIVYSFGKKSENIST